MARIVTQTTIFNSCKQLLDRTTRFIEQFPKTYKFTIGMQMINLSVEMQKTFTEAYMSNNYSDKFEYMNRFLSSYETYKVLFRMAYDNKWRYGQQNNSPVIQLIVAIGKEAVSYRKSLLQKIETTTVAIEDGLNAES